MKKITGIIIGLVLVVSGVIYMFDIFGIVDIDFSFDGWWAFFIIIPCFRGLFINKEKFGNILGLVVGILLLFAAQGVIDYEMVWKIVVPVTIVLVGIKMITKPVAHKTDTTKAQNENMAVFNSQNFNYAGEEITVAKIGAVFGGAECNLTDAKIKDGSQLDLFCAFGGVDIIVPENVSVKVNTFCLFGGISDKRELKPVDIEKTTLTINGFCIFGGADIK